MHNDRDPRTGRFAVKTSNAPESVKSDFETGNELFVKATGRVPTELAYEVREPIAGPAKIELYPHLKPRKPIEANGGSGEHLGDVIVHPDRAGRKRDLHEAAAADDDVIRNLLT